MVITFPTRPRVPVMTDMAQTTVTTPTTAATTPTEAPCETSPESASPCQGHDQHRGGDGGAPPETVPWETVLMARGIMCELANWTPEDWRWCMEQAMAGDEVMRRCQYMFAILAYHAGHDNIARWMAHDRRGMSSVLRAAPPRPHLVPASASRR